MGWSGVTGAWGQGEAPVAMPVSVHYGAATSTALTYAKRAPFGCTAFQMLWGLELAAWLRRPLSFQEPLRPARRVRTAWASCCSTGTVCSMLMQASVSDTP